MAEKIFGMKYLERTKSNQHGGRRATLVSINMKPAVRTTAKNNNVAISADQQSIF